MTETTCTCSAPDYHDHLCRIHGAELFTDTDGCVWRHHPEVPGEWQIFIECSRSWSDADRFPEEDGPLTPLADLEDRPRVVVCDGSCDPGELR